MEYQNVGSSPRIRRIEHFTRHCYDPVFSDTVGSASSAVESYRFGGLQDIRKTCGPLQKRPNRHPFGSAHEDWAHHVRGREELQFNIGEDEGMLRWGVHAWGFGSPDGSVAKRGLESVDGRPLGQAVDTRQITRG